MNTQPDFDMDPAGEALPAGVETRFDASVWRLLVAIALTVAAMLIAAELGGLLATFGLAGVALALAVVALIAGLLIGRRLMLPIGLAAAALTLPAAFVALHHHRVARSAGLLTVQPAASSEIDQHTFRRGAGSVFLDLRKMTTRPGETITVSARADTGRVVVALPHDRCFNLRVRSRTLPGPTRVGRTMMKIAGIAPASTDDSDDFVSAFATRRPDRPILELPPRSLVAFGELITAREWQRSADTPDAPTLILDLAGAGTSTVRDYPDAVGPLTPTLGTFDEQVGTRSWPAAVRLPQPPEVLRQSDIWRPKWTDAQRRAGIPQRWKAWERRFIAAAHEQSRRAAGPCAPGEVLEDTWSSIAYGSFGRTLAVNGKGRVLRWSYDAQGVFVPSTEPVVREDMR